MRYHFKIHKEGKGFWAECLELQGCFTQADNREDLVENMEESLNTYLQEPSGSDYLAPLPDRKIKKTRSVIEVQVDPETAMAFTLRYNRIKSRKTQEEVSEALGMKNLYSYQRLERRCNPTLSMIARLLEVYPKLSLDRILK